MDQSGGLYAKLEERILARDQIGASAVYYDLVRAVRPRAEIVGETVRIHAPYTHVPYHQPFLLDGPFEERLNHWLTLVQRGDVLEAYRVFLGLFAERERRPGLLAHLAFAGLIDVQDRMLYNRSYTTGHKAHRARATIEIGEAVGWEAAHDVLYAGALDMAVGPRWHSAYEMACQVSWMHLAEDDAKVKASMEPSPKRLVEARLLANSVSLTPAEAQRLQRAILDEPEPAYIHEITTLLLAGNDPRQIFDAIQGAAARGVLSVRGPG